MWHRCYPDRLRSWHDLRSRCQTLRIEQALFDINSWWFSAPWRPYYLHWDDWKQWPDPWQLLDNDEFCGVARALGIMYTVSMISHEEIHEICLAETATDNLVLVNQAKYILNWDPAHIVNISPGASDIRRTISTQQLEQRSR